MNLRNAEYCIFNEQKTKEEYLQTLADLRLDTYEGFLRARDLFFGEFRRKFPFRVTYQNRCENCEETDHSNSRNLTACFQADKTEDTVLSAYLAETYDSVDVNYAGFERCELCYQAIRITDLYHGISVDSCWHGSELAYCAYCFSSTNCFGCLSLQRGEYCVLNKRYSKEEYEALVTEIVEKMIERGEWGMFFPKAFSPFSYSETAAQEWFPLEGAQALALGYSSRESILTRRGKPVSEMPECIKDVDDDVVGEVWSCNECEKGYRIIDSELAFYRLLNLPLPRNCIDCRQRRRLTLHNPWQLWTRSCAACAQVIQTTFSPDRPETVVCEQCYRESIIFVMVFDAL